MLVFLEIFAHLLSGWPLRGTVDDNEWELFLLTSTKSLKGANKKWEKEDVLRHVNDSLDKNIAKEILEKILQAIIKNNSVKLNHMRNPECLTLSKETQQIWKSK